MGYFRITPASVEFIWGGNKLIDYGGSSKIKNLGEIWNFSFHKNGLCYIGDKPINEVLTSEVLGNKYSRFSTFPFLIKFIDSKENLSIQVHPSQRYAKKREKSNGKIEMWYILEAEKDAFIYLGFKNNESKDSIKEMIKNNSICDSLNKIKVKPGECYLVKPGLVHAIGAGVTLLEIQQNSDVTYRLYDYDRLDKNGKKRTLHIEDALNVINFKKYKNKSDTKLAKTKYFINKLIENNFVVTSKNNAGVVITVIEGNGEIDKDKFTKGNTFFVPAGQQATLKGDYKAIITRI